MPPGMTLARVLTALPCPYCPCSGSFDVAADISRAIPGRRVAAEAGLKSTRA